MINEKAVSEGEMKPAAERPSTDRFVMLVRHGIAEDRGEGKLDEERRLTPDGRRRMKQVACGLVRLMPLSDAIYTSPLIRCAETAELISRSYDDLAPKAYEGLRPDADAIDLAAWVLDRIAGNLIVVGHEPLLSATLLALVGLEGRAGIELRKGGCYGLSVRPHGVSLEWMLPPRILRRL